MEFFRRAPEPPGKLGVLPGSFNPPTRAHLWLAHAALGTVGEVLFVLPRAFPHKTYEGASFEDRLRMLERALAGEPRFSIAASEAGLFIDIARECRAAYGEDTEIHILCGRDAAGRIVEWDYGRPSAGRPGAIEEQLREYQLLVAPRQGPYHPPPHLRGRIHPLDITGDYDSCSASEVRRRIVEGEDWEHLVPEAIAELVRAIYSTR